MLYFASQNENFKLYQGDSLKILATFDSHFDMVFADPPYFLSNDGLTVKNGLIQSVNKGHWDKLSSINDMDNFNHQWLSCIRTKLKDNGTIWVSGTHHNIFSIAQVMTVLGFKVLNMITWEKPNPPPNFSCRYFTYSTEWIIWARKEHNIPHYYNYKLMKKLNGNKQLKDVWRLKSVATWEKTCGKHPTQKPLALLARIILASTKAGDLILDPFSGSATTGIAAQLLNRQFIGIEQDAGFLALAKQRYDELHDISLAKKMKQKIRAQISVL